MLTGLFPPDSGGISILGIDALADSEKVKHLTGIVPQDLALYPALSGRENLRFFGEMYGLGGKRLKERIDSVLDIVAMTDRAGDPVRTYSGGMKRRLNLAIGLINNPRILFLDEPTVGVDPQSRNHIFESVERLNREQGMTVLYTTHYMEEAQRLCRRVAIIDHGKVIALDTPHSLIAMLGGGIIQVGLPLDGESLNQSLLDEVCQLSQVREASYLTQPGNEDGSGRALLKVEARRASEALIQIIQLFNQRGIEILTIETLVPNLESVFLHLTGKSLRQ
jgi:ABC-2 type transport system ATP-binding protein